MGDWTATLEAKSDQLNAVDLIGAPLTITITDVKLVKDPAQPAIVSYEGDKGKPWKPSKGMRRLMSLVWETDDYKSFIGRQLTLYRWSDAIYAGKEVGGIRFSHASNITETKKVYLCESRNKQVLYVVEPLVSAPQKQLTETEADTFTAEFDDAKTMADIQSITKKIKELGFDAEGRKLLASMRTGALEIIRNAANKEQK